MNCYKHTDVVSVAQCQDCQKGLCSICTNNYSIPICTECNAERANVEKQDVVKELFFTFGFGVIASYYYVNSDNFQNSSIDVKILSGIFFTYFFSSCVAGWKTLNKITSNYFIFMPIIGWLIYFGFKLSISATIGWFMLPIRTYNNISKLKKINSINKTV